MKRPETPTNGKCENFINGNCGFDCPNAALEAACDRWDLDPSDFGMERIKCTECQYWDDNCTCEDCFVQFDPEYCPNPKKPEKEVNELIFSRLSSGVRTNLTSDEL